MDEVEKKRNYNMQQRAAKVAATEKRILEEAIGLWHEMGPEDITLEMIAERSGVSTRTLLRKYGSRDGLIRACILHDASSNRRTRLIGRAGDIRDLLHYLLEEYEEMGDAVMRTVYAAGQHEIAGVILENGRSVHRKWCEDSFAPYLKDCNGEEYETRLLAFIAATEIYLWKLLRRDLGKSREETFNVFYTMLTALTR